MSEDRRRSVVRGYGAYLGRQDYVLEASDTYDGHEQYACIHMRAIKR